MTITTSSGRRPRGVVKINGVPVSFLSANVENKSHFSADTWRVKLEAWQQPEGYGMAYWADATDVQVEVLFGQLQEGDDVSARPASVTSLILGQVDDVEIDPLDGDSLIISGRDLSARMIDTKTTNKWPDHVSSWIVTEIAKQFDLTPQVTATKTPVGQFYNSTYSNLARDVPTWDLLVFLAQQEGFDCYVRGSTLYFGPPQADNDASPTIITLTGTDGVQSNCTRLRLRRSLTLAQDISVTVLSHNVAIGKSVRAIATRAGKRPATTSSSKAAEKIQSYVLRRAGLSQEQAQQLANKTLLDLTKFERTFEATMEGDPLLTVQKRAVIQGTQTSYDQSYYIHNISRTIDFDGGFVMSFSGKNHSTETNPEI